MPIYEYRCDDCSAEFEELQKVGAAPPPCQKCGGDQVNKLVSPTSFVLKGGGWYKDGYTGASNRKADSAGSSTDSAASSSESKSSSSESKSSSSSESKGSSSSTSASAD